MTTVRGRISVHPRGFGFLMVEGPPGEERSAFVPPPDLNPFLDGDLVSATLVAADAGRWNATALALVERTRTQLFGTVTTRGRRPFLHVDRIVSNTDWPIDEAAGQGLTDGSYLVGELRGGKVFPVRAVPEDADLGLERCVVRHGIRSDFSPEQVAAAREAVGKARHGSSLGGPRRDLRALPTVTIDAPSTTDIDDALSVLPAGPDGALRALISIADVDAFVGEGSLVDLEARARGTSVYLAGRVIPMLPDVLSADAISLVEGKERLTLTVELRIDPEGEVTSVDLYESLIRSHGRLDYDACTEFFATGHSAGVPAAVRPTLRWLRTAAARLSAVRAARGGVELVREEAYVSLDRDTGEPTSVAPRADTEAHRVVERLMVAANEAVARWLSDRGLPGIYRVHPEPDAERVQALAVFARNFGIETGFGAALTPRGLAAFEAQFRASPFAPALRTVLGKALGPARYTVHPSAHFGLAAPLYLHFTSPIRRYADLSVHRIIKRYLGGERGMAAGDPALEALSQHLNRAAYSATKAEAERHRMLIARLFAGLVGEEVAGNVVSVKPFGLVVQMEGTGATGTIATDALPGGPYVVDLVAQALIGPDRRYSVGDPLRATIAGTNEELGRVDLALVEDPAGDDEG